jgi:hypothetical protein
VDILTPLITAGAAVLAVIIGNRLSYTRSYNEKIWDLKRPAYGLVLSELGEIESICDSADEYIDQDSERYFETAEQKDNTKIAKHFETINKRIADDYLILSVEFHTLYDEFRKAMSTDPYDYSDPSEDHEVFATAVRKYRPLLIKLCRSEIAIGERWSIFRLLGGAPFLLLRLRWNAFWRYTP